MQGVRAKHHWQDNGGDSHSCRLLLSGNWTVRHLAGVGSPPVPPAREISLCADSLQLDSAGALILGRWLDEWMALGHTVDTRPLGDELIKLLELVRINRCDMIPQAPLRTRGVAALGRYTLIQLAEASRFLHFVGELAWRGIPHMVRFWHIRWREVFGEIEAAGVRALGIVGLLSFLIGMVMAYQAGTTLANYGASFLIVDLVGIITLREMGPLLTAIVVAGRTGSSYTAQIGTMRITEEIDALRVLGMSPFDVLILPKVLALLITLPLLSLFADIMGLLGGGLVAATGYGVPWSSYIERIPDAVSPTTLILGLIKAPAFAVIIALIGCMQGMRVRGSAAEVGRATTTSVVQSIFMVIVIDASFSILYNLLGL